MIFNKNKKKLQKRPKRERIQIEKLANYQLARIDPNNNIKKLFSSRNNNTYITNFYL